MSTLTKDDVAAWDLGKVNAEWRRRMDEVHSMREKNGGSLVGMKGSDADSVREHMADLNDVIGPRRDELKAQDKLDSNFQSLQSYMTEPANDHPGHSGGNGAARRTKIGPAGDLRADQLRDIGGLFVSSEAYEAYKEDGTLERAVNVPISSLWPHYRGIGEVPSQGLNMNAALFDSTQYPIQPQFIAQPIEQLYQANNIGPLFSQGTTAAQVVRYPVETVTATGAAETAEGITKPEAQLSFAPVDEPVRKIAVVLPLTDESLEDVPLLRAYINARLRLFVQMREDSQLLNGNGTAPNLKGIFNRSGINTATSYSIGGANADQALVEAFFHAAMRVRDAFLEPDAAVTKPSTWEIAVLAKDANRNYLLGGPGAAGYAGQAAGGLNSVPRIWGLPVILNANVPAQSATNKVGLVGAFAAGGMLIRRSGIDLAMSDSHSTFFYENKIALRAEERLALAIWRPAAFAAITSAA